MSSRNPEPGRVMRVRAPAKVNLLLRVLQREADGYHRLETLFQAVGLEDVLVFTVVEPGAFSLDVVGATVGPVEENLVTRAVRAFQAATGTSAGLRVGLEKRIPAGAGLGGGSSDAGSTLRVLNLLHGHPLDEEELMAVGAGLGADVAFFSGSAGYALGEGRGDRLRALPPLPPATLLLGMPGTQVATGPAYAALARVRAEAGGKVPPPLLRGRAPSRWDEIRTLGVNDFQEVVAGSHPPVREALDLLRRCGAPLALLSGSGAAVFGLPWHDDPARCLAELREGSRGIRWWAVDTLERLPSPEEVDHGVPLV